MPAKEEREEKVLCGPECPLLSTSRARLIEVTYINPIYQ